MSTPSAASCQGALYLVDYPGFQTAYGLPRWSVFIWKCVSHPRLYRAEGMLHSLASHAHLVRISIELRLHGLGSGAASRSTWPSERFGTGLGTKQLNRSEPGAISLSMTSPYARLSGGRERQSLMLTTLLVIVACFAAGTIVHHIEHARRRW
jgi:hypothetical protein